MIIKGINLIPPEAKERWRARRWRAVIVIACAVYAAAFMAVYVRQRSSAAGRLRQVEALKAERDRGFSRMSGYAEFTKKLADLQKAEAEIGKRLGAAGVIGAERVSWADVLRRISRDVPPDVWLKSISTSDAASSGAGKRIKFIGSSSANSGVTSLLFALENSGYCRNATLVYSQRRAGADAVFDFEINADIKPTAGAAYE
ncbi:MAG: PilN domain-containing protein [Deltaproteobacteria bacterium]|nr:PilN domain-containing protein [Deltaproteobacteria bacterium]